VSMKATFKCVKNNGVFAELRLAHEDLLYFSKDSSVVLYWSKAYETKEKFLEEHPVGATYHLRLTKDEEGPDEALIQKRVPRK
jgi:hypothetical protein